MEGGQGVTEWKGPSGNRNSGRPYDRWVDEDRTWPASTGYRSQWHKEYEYYKKCILYFFICNYSYGYK